MRALTVVVGCALCTACQGEIGFPGGTGVGNPSCTRPSVARTSGITLTEAHATLESFTVELCGRAPDVVEVGEAVDLLDAPWFELPGGAWCSVTATWSTPMVLEGFVSSGATLMAAVPVADVVLLAPEGGVFVSDDELVLELGSPEWLRTEGVPVPQEGDVVLAETSDAAAVLAHAIMVGSALFADDGDGVVDGAERAAGPAASGSPTGDGDGDGDNPAGG